MGFAPNTTMHRVSFAYLVRDRARRTTAATSRASPRPPRRATATSAPSLPHSPSLPFLVRLLEKLHQLRGSDDVPSGAVAGWIMWMACLPALPGGGDDWQFGRVRRSRPCTEYTAEEPPYG